MAEAKRAGAMGVVSADMVMVEDCSRGRISAAVVDDG